MKTLPEDFIQYTQELMGDELFQQLKQGITEGEAPTSIRLNPFKCKEGEDAAGEPIPWCPSTGRYLSTRPNFTFDPWLHSGKYYVQEASSMFVDLVIRQLVHKPVMMLDLCAAPGGNLPPFVLPCRKAVFFSATNRCAPDRRFLQRISRSSVIPI